MQSVLSTLSEENSSLPAPPQLSEVLFLSHGSPDYFSHFSAALRALSIGPKLDPITEMTKLYLSGYMQHKSVLPK